MIIGIDASAYSFMSTGTGRYIECLTEQLNNTGNEIKVFPRTPENFENVKTYSLNRKMQGIKRHYYRMFMLTPELLNSNVDCAIFPNYFISNNFEKPSAIVIHDLSFITHPEFYSKKFVIYYQYLLKRTLKQNPLVLAVSEHTRDNISRHLNIKKESVLLLQGYSHIKSNFHNSENRNTPETPYLLYVGHIEPRKNLTFMVENFLKWKNEACIDIKLKLIGKFWIKSGETNNLLKNYGKHQDIIFKGYVSEEELNLQYKNAFGFVHTSFEEGFGFPVFEAMNYGLPLICSKGHAAEEISSPFSITIDPHDAGSFIKGLHKLYEMRNNDRIPEYKLRYSPEVMGEQLSVVLDRLESLVRKNIYINSGKSKTHEEAIEKTLLYSHLFNGGLHINNLYTYLFDLRINEDQFEKALLNLQMLNRVNLENGNVSLNYHNIKIYNREIKRMEKKKINRSLKILNSIPFISCICFSGGTANYGIEDHNDIDLFIIAKPHTLYLVYLTVHIISKIFKVRKQLCTNFLIDETELEIKDQHDYYTAHQIVSLVPYKNYNMLHAFLTNNLWTKEFFPNFICQLPVMPGRKKNTMFYFLLKPMNIVLKYFYRLLYKNKIKGFSQNSVKLNNKCIKLYTNDHRVQVLGAFNQEWRKYSEKVLLNSLHKTEKAVQGYSLLQ